MNTLPQITTNEFISRIKKRKLENVEVINLIEKYLIKKRGFIARLPRPRSPVILLLSGGIDSITTWWLLLEKYKLDVYPLFLARDKKRTKKERESVMFFYEFFRRKYSKAVHFPQEYTTPIPPVEIENLLTKNINIHPSRILMHMDTNSNKSVVYSNNIVTSYLFSFYALFYAKQINEFSNIKIHTIITAITPNDGEDNSSQTFTALRTSLLSFCNVLNDYSLQYFSLFFEKELGFWTEKAEIIRLATTGNLPLEKTWTCANNGHYQCGECALCLKRQLAFKKAQVTDNTSYATNIKNSQLKVRLIKRLHRLLTKIKLKLILS